MNNLPERVTRAIRPAAAAARKVAFEILSNIKPPAKLTRYELRVANIKKNLAEMDLTKPVIVVFHDGDAVRKYYDVHISVSDDCIIAQSIESHFGNAIKWDKYGREEEGPHVVERGQIKIIPYTNLIKVAIVAGKV